MKKSFIKKLSSIFMLCIIGILSSIIGLRLHDFNVLANTTTNGIFTGVSGSPEGEQLYNLTNTYNYKGDNTNFDRKYEYYDTSINGKNNNTVSTDAPLITVLTHGLGGSASHWSNINNYFAYDRQGIT